MNDPGGGGDGTPYTKKKLYQRIHNRLTTTEAFSNVRYTQTRIRPRAVVADVGPAVFVDPKYPATAVSLEIEFLLRNDWDHYWIQWIEPGRNFSCGWHQDETHIDLGKCHFQIDFPDGSTVREIAEYLEAHPLYIFESRLRDLPDRLLGIDLD